MTESNQTYMAVCYACNENFEKPCKSRRNLPYGRCKKCSKEHMKIYMRKYRENNPTYYDQNKILSKAWNAYYKYGTISPLIADSVKIKN